MTEIEGRVLAHPPRARGAALSRRRDAPIKECDLPVVLRVEEVAHLLRISRGLAYEACRTGVVPSFRIGKRILVPRDQLLERLKPSRRTNNG